MQGVILAAGKGKRLQPVTLARTKAMAPVAGKPIVARVLDLFLDNGIRDILLLISPDDHDIQPYFARQIAGSPNCRRCHHPICCAARTVGYGPRPLRWRP
ncbi:MAG: NTP transferase domain-containing protein [Caldilineaceae bacterium]